MTKPNFTIKPGCTVWLHNQAWRAGNEAAPNSRIAIANGRQQIQVPLLSVRNI